MTRSVRSVIFATRGPGEWPYGTLTEVCNSQDRTVRPVQMLAPAIRWLLFEHSTRSPALRARRSCCSRNYHRFLASPEVIQAIARQITAGKQNRTFVVVLAPIVDIPRELEKLFVVLEHQLPDRDQLTEIARGVATENGELPEGDDLQRVIDAAAGLSRFEAEGAYSLALVRHGRIEPTTIWQLKSQALVKSGLLSLHRGW